MSRPPVSPEVLPGGHGSKAARAPESAAPRLVTGISFRAFPAREISERVTRPDGALAAVNRQYRILETLRHAANQLVVHRPLPELFEELLDLLFAAVPAERGAVLLREGTSSNVVLRAQRSRGGAPPLSVSRTVARRVLEERVTLALGDVARDPAFSNSESLALGRVRSALCAPLWFAHEDGEQVVGVVYLDTTGDAFAFDEDDVGLVTVIANIAATKIHTAQLLAEQFQKRRLEHEMRLAAEVQARLLPEGAPQLDGWGLGVVSRPCHAVGGDYFDWELSSDGLRITVADVAGKGASAALLMAAVRALVRAHWAESDLAAAALRIDRSVRDSVPDGRYATAFLGRLDPTTGCLIYVNAGHPAPLLVRSKGSVEPLQVGGLPFGLTEGRPYQSGLVRVERGDTLLVFSDGVTEACDVAGAEFGAERLVALARHGSELDAGAMARRIGVELDAYPDGAGTVDDRTLLVLRRHSARG
jgi:phosphoserine phosphatase RsbU/P